MQSRVCDLPCKPWKPSVKSDGLAGGGKAVKDVKGRKKKKAGDAEEEEEETYYDAMKKDMGDRAARIKVGEAFTRRSGRFECRAWRLHAIQEGCEFVLVANSTFVEQQDWTLAQDSRSGLTESVKMMQSCCI